MKRADKTVVSICDWRARRTNLRAQGGDDRQRLLDSYRRALVAAYTLEEEVKRFNSMDSDPISIGAVRRFARERAVERSGRDR